MQKLPCYKMSIVVFKTMMIIFGSMNLISQSNSGASGMKASRQMEVSTMSSDHIHSSRTTRNVIITTPKSRKLASNNFNAIDVCWRGDANWANDRMKLASCGVGFGYKTTGGKGGQIYVVTNSSDDAENPTEGTLRYGVIQSEPFWITFSQDMQIVLKNELLISSDKTIDGRGANVQIGFGPCLTLYEVSNVIIHSINIQNCVPSEPGLVRISPSKLISRSSSDGDAISVFHSNKIWIDHVSLSSSHDGLIDVVHGSTGVTISNSYFFEHDKVMLLGNDDSYIADKDMNVTIIYNLFGPSLVQRMPRCRIGLVHVINNDYPNGWTEYAIGGSANPTILSVGNRFKAPEMADRKEVTRRANSTDWKSWIWKSIDDTFLNGAFFTESGVDIEIGNYGLTTSSPFTPSMTTYAGALSCTVGSTC